MTAGSRSGWIRSPSNPARPSASPLPPNMPDAGWSNPSRPIGPHHGWCDGTVWNEETSMSKTVAAIRRVTARGLVAPIARPVKTAFALIEAAHMVLIDVETDQGVTGHAYIFAYTELTVKPLVHLIEGIGRDLVGRPVAPYDLMK